jgi:hypothetical protein
MTITNVYDVTYLRRNDAHFSTTLHVTDFRSYDVSCGSTIILRYSYDDDMLFNKGPRFNPEKGK